MANQRSCPCQCGWLNKMMKIDIKVGRASVTKSPIARCHLPGERSSVAVVTYPHSSRTIFGSITLHGISRGDGNSKFQAERPHHLESEGFGLAIHEASLASPLIAFVEVHRAIMTIKGKKKDAGRKKHRTPAGMRNCTPAYTTHILAGCLTRKTKLIWQKECATKGHLCRKTP